MNNDSEQKYFYNHDVILKGAPRPEESPEVSTDFVVNWGILRSLSLSQNDRLIANCSLFIAHC
jgi:hypothetical protein